MMSRLRSNSSRGQGAPVAAERIELEGGVSALATSFALAAKDSGVRGPRYQPLA